MEYYLLRKIDIDNLLSREHPRALEIVQENRIIEPIVDGNQRFRVIPGDQKQFMGLPACSLLTGSSDEPWYLDTGLQMDDGAVYIGAGDFKSMAAACGFVEAEHARRAQDRVAELERANVELSDRLDRITAGLSVLRDVERDKSQAANDEPGESEGSGRKPKPGNRPVASSAG